MSKATLTVQPFALVPGAQRVEVDCPRALAGCTWVNCGRVVMTRGDVTRVALGEPLPEDQMILPTVQEFLRRCGVARLQRERRGNIGPLPQSRCEASGQPTGRPMKKMLAARLLGCW